MIERDLEEAIWLWTALGRALRARSSACVAFHVYEAARAFRELSTHARKILADSFERGRRAARERGRMLDQLEEVARAERVLAGCEDELRRLRPEQADKPRCFAWAVEDVERWSERVRSLKAQSNG